ncbi:MAG TPA: cytochrome c maturation protein CcmE, partial [Bacteroidia bacterium]|nr:cytochrome c maturation protein CcmE [Bacteroidia bacterium]
IYDPKQDVNLFTFYMIDNQGVERKVFLHENKPQDFERSEQVVVIGKSRGQDEFDANKILMKCPSKYNDGKQK